MKSSVEVWIATEQLPKLTKQTPQVVQVAGIEGFWSNIDWVLAPWMAMT
jgi:hypothetical protein